MLISVTHSITPTLSTTAVSLTLASHSVRRLPPVAFGGGEAAVPLARVSMKRLSWKACVMECVTEINICLASRKRCHENREACVMESVTESNTCGASRKTVTENRHGNRHGKHDLCSVMEECNIPKFLLTQHSYYSTND